MRNRQDISPTQSHSMYSTYLADPESRMRIFVWGRPTGINGCIDVRLQETVAPSKKASALSANSDLRPSKGIIMPKEITERETSVTEHAHLYMLTCSSRPSRASIRPSSEFTFPFTKLPLSSRLFSISSTAFPSSSNASLTFFSSSSNPSSVV